MQIIGEQLKFERNEEFFKELKCLKEKLVKSPIMIAPDWSKTFELICDASGVTLGIVLWKKKQKLFHPIYYASKALNGALKNYTIIEQELLALVYAFEKVKAYLMGQKWWCIQTMQYYDI